LQQHDELRVGAAVRPEFVAGHERARQRMAACGNQPDQRRRTRHADLHAGRDVRRVGHRAGLPRREQLSCERHVRPDGERGRPDHHQLVQQGVRERADRSEPAVRQRGAEHRPRTDVLADGSGGVEDVRGRRPGEIRVPARGVQSAEPHEFRRAQRQPQLRRVRHDHVALRSAPAAARIQAAVVRRRIALSLLSCALAGAASPSPLIIGHRGASGYRPEHTLEGYRLAAQMGADFIEPDLVSTKDGILIARHENEIGGTTDGADRFPDRRTTKTVDGQSIAGWFTEDFTLAEIKTLRAKERLATRSHDYDGKFQVPTFDEVLDLAQQLGRELRRPIGVYPETKHPTYFRGLGLPLEARLLASLEAHGWNRRDAPVFIQSFEQGNLKALRGQTSVRLIQLVSDPSLVAGGGLWGGAAAAAGTGRGERLVVPVTRAGSLGGPTELGGRAHAAGLLVHVWTVRIDKEFLPAGYHGKPEAEFEQLRALGVDG